MEIKIGKKEIEQPVYKNCYKVHINYMIGDADGDDEDIVYIDKNNESFEDFIKCLEMCCRAFDVGGMGGMDTFKNVPGYKDFFGDSWDDDEEDEDEEDEDDDNYDEEDEDDDNYDEEDEDDDSKDDEDNEDYEEDEDEDEDEYEVMNTDDSKEDDEDANFYVQKGKGIGADHPYQPDDYGIECSFEDYEITFFDSNSKEFPVKVNFTPEEKEEMRTKLNKAGYSVKKKW